MRRAVRFVSAVLIVGAATVRAAEAQTPPAGPGRLEASFGALWLGRQVLGSADANETTPTNGALKVFSTGSQLASVLGFEGRVAVRLLPTLEVGVEGSYGVPQLKIAISGDIEGASGVTAVEEVQQFTIGGDVVWYVPVRAMRPRLVPFVAAGVGQLRQMHQERVLLQTGRYLQVGGGVKAFLFSRERGFVNAFGARVDLRALMRTDGVAFDDRRHTSPAFGIAAFVQF